MEPEHLGQTAGTRMEVERLRGGTRGVKKKRIRR